MYELQFNNSFRKDKTYKSIHLQLKSQTLKTRLDMFDVFFSNFFFLINNLRDELFFNIVYIAIGKVSMAYSVRIWKTLITWNICVKCSNGHKMTIRFLQLKVVSGKKLQRKNNDLDSEAISGGPTKPEWSSFKLCLPTTKPQTSPMQVTKTLS